MEFWAKLQIGEALLRYQELGQRRVRFVAPPPAACAAAFRFW